jgi:hypothetical protein
MHQVPQVPFDDHQEDSENSLNIPQHERFEKRLNLYRSHTNECKLRVDQSINELSEQQTHEIAELQKKSKDCGKQKRVNKRGIRKQMEINKV